MAAGLIQSIAYDEAKLELRVVFADGHMAVHRGVPSRIHAALMSAAAQADFYLTHVREQFPSA